MQGGFIAQRNIEGGYGRIVHDASFPNLCIATSLYVKLRQTAKSLADFLSAMSLTRKRNVLKNQIFPH
jgi:hypothetical protein